jgi:hypothetical protein
MLCIANAIANIFIPYSGKHSTFTHQQEVNILQTKLSRKPQHQSNHVGTWGMPKFMEKLSVAQSMKFVRVFGTEFSPTIQ